MFKLGDYNVICDRCGGKLKASEARLTWEGFYVHSTTYKCWEPRHPQDFVHGVEDDQTVPIARSDINQTQGTTTLSSAASQWDGYVIVTSANGISNGSGIGITMDNGIIHWTYSYGSPSGTTVTLGSRIPFSAASGNTVYIPDINNEKWTSATTLTATEL